MTGPDLKMYRLTVLGMTQTELAEAIDITPRSLSTYENTKGKIAKVIELAILSIKSVN